MATALAYWRELAYALDDAAVYQVAAASSTTITPGGLASSESGASPNRYDHRWVAVVSGNGTGQQRSVVPGSYVPSTGLLTLAVGWSTVPIGNDLVMLTGLFPVFEGVVAGEDTSYRDLVNRALALILVPDRVDLAVTDDSTALTLPWLDREGRLDTSDGEGWLLEPSPVSGRRARPCMWRGPKLVMDGQSPTLELKAPLAATLTLKVRRPGNTWIATASSWNETPASGGLVNASDEAIPTIEEVVTVGKMLAYQALMGRSPGRPSGNWADKYADARAEAMKLDRFDHTLYAAAPAAPGAA